MGPSGTTALPAGWEAGTTIGLSLARELRHTPIMIFHRLRRREIRPFQEVMEHFLLQLNHQGFVLVR